MVDRALAAIEELSDWIDEIPPIQQPMRYGNKAYRDWFDRLAARTEEQMRKVLPEEHAYAAVELSVYFREAWGNRTRIDYGTGHETCFVVWMFCLFKLGAVTAADSQALVNIVFASYVSRDPRGWS